MLRKFICTILSVVNVSGSCHSMSGLDELHCNLNSNRNARIRTLSKIVDSNIEHEVYKNFVRFQDFTSRNQLVNVALKIKREGNNDILYVNQKHKLWEKHYYHRRCITNDKLPIVLAKKNLYNFNLTDFVSSGTTYLSKHTTIQSEPYSFPSIPPMQPSTSPPSPPRAPMVCEDFRIVTSKSSLQANFMYQTSLMLAMALGIENQCGPAVIAASNPVTFPCWDMASPLSMTPGGDFIPDGEVNIIDYNRQVRLQSLPGLGEGMGIQAMYMSRLLYPSGVSDCFGNRRELIAQISKSWTVTCPVSL